MADIDERLSPVPVLDGASTHEEVQALFEELHAADFADLVERSEPDVALRLLHALDPEQAAEVLECVEPDRRVSLVGQLGTARTAEILDEMSADDRADLLSELDEPVAEAVLARMDPEEAADVRSLAAYDEGTVGALMTTEVLTVPVDMDVAAVIQRVRSHGEEAETVHYVYVVAPGDVLVGVVSLRELILAHPDHQVANVMREEVISVLPTAPQEQAARLIEHYDLIAVPVVDPSRRLLGLVTVDDVMDILNEQTTADFHRVGGMAPVDTSYFSTSFWRLFAKRAPWLVALFVGGAFTAEALGHFEDMIQRATVLVLFLPLILSSGGNSGSQSASLIIRGLAVGEVSIAQAWRVLAREWLMGVALGATLCLIGAARALIWGNGGEIAIVIGVSLVAVVMVGTVIGSMLPLLLERFGLDPAVSSTPFIASLSDLLGVVVYFTIAHAVLGI